MDDVTERHRGASTSHMRAFVCKECQREVERLEREVATLEQASGRNCKRLAKTRADLQRRRDKATYNENWARNVIERGGSRSDRCREHRQRHRTYIQGIAVAYIDLETVGEIADRTNPTGPLGGSGPLPTVHEIVENTSYDLQKVNVGMTDEHIVEMIRLLRERRVLILKAGTGTGKSTFAPYRLMDPPSESQTGLPADAPFGRLTELGPIIVTEPRVQAAVGVATFVGAVMSGAGGVGPGYPVGYQVSGDRAHDEACELIYVTDGTMINWLREGRLSRIGTVIVDEAHERSTNIDFIMGFLRRELDRYPHLRVIITSATFNAEFYQEFFGGPDVGHVMEVPAEKSFGYGMPLFPALDTPESGEDDVLERWRDESLPLSGQHPRDEKEFLRRHWPTRHAPPLGEDDVLDPDDIGYREDVWHTTAQLLDLRYTSQVPAARWRERMPAEMTEFIVRLTKGLDERGIYGDILGFLPTRRTIDPVCAEIERQLGRAYEGHVFPLISALGKEQQRAALAKRRKGDPRKIVISTNLAETSLTVEGVRFVVDSGVIAQSEWDPELAKGDIPTKPHSQAGIKQRWGQVGRKAPGWVFPLYTKGQYLDLAEDTPPGSTRENLEALVMTARMGGIDDVLTFPWPAAFEPTTTELDDTARQAMRTFQRELVRADAALRAGGAVDGDGHPTSFGRELIRFQGLGSTGSALAILYADRLACVPEVATVLALLEDTRLVGRRGLLQDDPEWPDEWRLEAADRHRGLASLCADDAELVLLIAAAWDRADPASAPWEPSRARERWTRQWWLNHDLLLETAQKRQQILAALSPAMKDEVKRFLELSVIDRVRGVLTRSLAGHRFRRTDDGLFGRADPQAGEDTAFALEDDTLVVPAAAEVIALRRREACTDSRISNLVIAQPWALAEPGSAQPTGTADATRMVVAASRHAPTRPDLSRHLAILASWPVGQRIRLRTSTAGKEAPETAIDEVLATIEPFPQPVGETTPGRRRRSRRADPDDAEATRADIDGDLRPQTGRIGYADEHTLRENAFRRNDLEVDAYAACGACPRCLAGRTAACEQLSRREPTAAAREDPVREWQAAARRGIDVSTPPVVVPGRTLDEQRWYEVTSYRPGNGEVAVQLRPDWRNGAQGNPAQHQGVQAGDPIEVRVGPALRHHGGALRSFERVDGRGRFVLAEASTHRADLQEKQREIAVSLHRGAHGLLDSLQPGATLVATVMPARARNCYTITLLELLHQHLSKASPGSGIEYQAPDPTRRVAARTKLYNAIVSQPPNDAGYAQAVLLHRDSARGIRHLVTLPARPTANDEAAPAMTIGQPLLLNLVRDKSRLDVSDLDLAELRDIVRHSNRQLDLTGVDDDTEDKEFAPPGAVLLARSDKPLSRSAAIRLAQLSDNPQWANEVWSFWARSHHVALGNAPAYRSGTRTEPVEITADVVIAVESPLEQQRRLTSRYTEQHPAAR
ncbi:DEAD/DEAH box helicase [Micromonospora sp. D75]|uniref:DEAD/DEAH box helicase n=1 Tax=Micromonospora sp. D75 TaxID=2824885 RepID=UPI001B38EB4E|nr:DEAD/DEAH box helicase [Micromonospora sp. D75]MBQ1065215.1 DEAD/DEAH box helicase [Micromonospora sp. D75]